MATNDIPGIVSLTGKGLLRCHDQENGFEGRSIPSLLQMQDLGQMDGKMIAFMAVLLRDLIDVL